MGEKKKLVAPPLPTAEDMNTMSTQMKMVRMDLHELWNEYSKPPPKGKAPSPSLLLTWVLGDVLALAADAGISKRDLEYELVSCLGILLGTLFEYDPDDDRWERTLDKLDRILENEWRERTRE